MEEEKKKSAKIFICHHPGGLLFYKNLAKITKMLDKNTETALFKVNHNYFSKFNFEQYKEYFDVIVEFDFINYEKNIIKEFFKILKFKKKLSDIEKSLLSKFESIDLFSDYSAWLPVNFLIHSLFKNKKIKNIKLFRYIEPKISQLKVSFIKTLFCNIYTTLFGIYRIQALTTEKGKFSNFVYKGDINGEIINILSPFAKKKESKNDIIFPVIPKNQKKSKREMVVVFGDSTVFGHLSEYFVDIKEAKQKMTAFFKTLEEKYPGKLYYKSHPSEGGKIMPGIDLKKYKIIDSGFSAESLLEAHYSEVKAVYTFSSNSIVNYSFVGIPSYTFYKYLFNKAGVDKFDSIFEAENIKSKYIFNISDLSQIGKIDKSIKLKSFDKEKIKKQYQKILNI